MNILILGGTGFIGSHLIDSLSTKGHFLTVVDRTLKYAPQHKNIRYYQADIQRLTDIEDIFTGQDLIIHLVSTTNPQSSNADPIFDTTSNLVSSLSLLEIMKKQAVPRLIYFSSGGTVYGIPSNIPIKESHPTQPICSYGITKLAIENHIKMYMDLYDIQATILRPSNPYGPRQSHIGVQGVISTFTNRILNEENITLWGDGNVVRDYLYVLDLISACNAAIEKNVTGTFNIGSGKGYSLNQIISQIELITGKQAHIEYQPKRNFDVPEIYLDITEANSRLGWRPETDLTQGITQYIEWLLSSNTH